MLELNVAIITNITILLRNQIVTGFVWNGREIVVSLRKKRNDGNNTELFIRSAEITGRIRLADLRHEDDERGFAEACRTSVKVHIVEDDDQPVHRDADGYAGDLCRTVIIGHNGDDGIVRLGRTADTGSGHQHHHGGEHRYDADGVDHVAGL